MAKNKHVCVQVVLVTLIYLIPFAFCKDSSPIPANINQVESWFQQNVQPAASRKGVIEDALLAAEAKVRVIKMRPDGKGEFKTLTQAIQSVESGNVNRVILLLAPGKYKEKVKIDKKRKFLTFYGQDPKNKPVLTFDGTAAKFGTFYSATLTVEGDYFSAVNIRIENSSPRPALGKSNQQAVAMRIAGDKSSFFNCEFIGFQDTLLDDTGRHFFKDCYIEGTVDFIFGAGKSLYLNCELHIIPGDGVNYVTAQGGPAKIASSGYSFVHCKVTGGHQSTGYLGRAWREYPQTVFSYSILSDTVNQLAWSNNGNSRLDGTVYFAEFSNTGPRADLSKRYKYVKKFTAPQAVPFISLQYIVGSTWLIPPRKP